MSDEYFDRAPTTFKDFNVTDDQINALKACVDDRLAAGDAATHITKYPEASSTPIEMKLRLGGLWTLLNDTAVFLPSAQPSIISILQAIQKLPKAQEPHGEGEGCVDLEDGFYWRELTDWAINWADNWNSHAARFSMYPDVSEEEHAKRKGIWTNACEYAARLAAAGDEALSSYEAGLDRASTAIAEALEVDNGEKEPESLEAAAQLFLHAAPVLHTRSKNRRKEGMKTKKDGLWHGQDGFSEERWEFWKERWAVLADVRGFSDEARAVARKAIEAMDRAET